MKEVSGGMRCVRLHRARYRAQAVRDAGCRAGETPDPRREGPVVPGRGGSHSGRDVGTGCIAEWAAARNQGSNLVSAAVLTEGVLQRIAEDGQECMALAWSSALPHSKAVASGKSEAAFARWP